MYYVYELVDPRDETVFYVGKGKGQRFKQHVKDAKRGGVGLKCDLIREILGAGVDVEERIVRRFDSEDKAFSFERRRIAKYGLDNLTNLAAGGREMTAAEFKDRKDARRMARTASRMCRVLQKHKEVGMRWAGIWVDIPRTAAETMLRKSISYVFDVLGDSEARAEFLKHNVLIENKA